MNSGDLPDCGHDHWAPYGFVQTDCGGLTPADYCQLCGKIRYAPVSPHFGEVLLLNPERPGTALTTLHASFVS